MEQSEKKPYQAPPLVSLVPKTLLTDTDLYPLDTDIAYVRIFVTYKYRLLLPQISNTQYG